MVIQIGMFSPIRVVLSVLDSVILVCASSAFASCSVSICACDCAYACVG